MRAIRGPARWNPLEQPNLNKEKTSCSDARSVFLTIQKDSFDSRPNRCRLMPDVKELLTNQNVVC